MTVLIVAVLTMTLTGASAGRDAEERAKELEGKIIAPCCWTQPVSQHNSEAAAGIRAEIRRMIVAGETDERILDQYVSEYGERILASPPFRGFNAVRYLLPWVAVLMGFCILGLALKRLLGASRLVSDRVPPTPGPSAGYDARIDRELHQLD